MEVHPKTNYFVVCPDDLGLRMLVKIPLRKIATPKDVEFFAGKKFTKDKARKLERDARKAPSGGSKYQHFIITELQKIPTESVGPLLKVVEEARWSRFVFQAQHVPRRVRTLMSRSRVVRLPFLSRKVVLGNLRTLQYDAKTADERGFYDGTLEGTIKSLNMKDLVLELRKEVKKGMLSLPWLMTTEVVNSLAFRHAMYDFMTVGERGYLEVEDTEDRRRLVLYQVLTRQ